MPETAFHFARIESTDRESVAQFLRAQIWPYHLYTTYDDALVTKVLDEGFAGKDGVEAYWMSAEGERVGIVRVTDLDDPAPLLDLRLKETVRGRGWGAVMLAWITRQFFEHHPDKVRIGGYTRQDNVAMQRVFEACGYRREAHYRLAWPDLEGGLYDTLGYGILRDEWIGSRKDT